MRLPVLISVCLSLATTWLIAKNTEFSQSRNLPPLRLAAADLDTILLRTQSLIAEANGPSSEHDSGRESVKLGIGGREIEIPHLSPRAALRFRRKLFRFCYTYSRPNKPISSVTLDFSDYSRQVSVTGEAADRVEALSKLVEKDFLHYSTAIGGATFRRVAGVCLSLTFLASLIVSAYWWNTRTYSALGMLVCSGLGYSCYFSSHGTGTLRASRCTKATRLSFSSDMPLRFSFSALSRLFSGFPSPIVFRDGESAIISNEVLHGRQLNSSKYYASSFESFSRSFFRREALRHPHADC